SPGNRVAVRQPRNEHRQAASSLNRADIGHAQPRVPEPIFFHLWRRGDADEGPPPAVGHYRTVSEFIHHVSPKMNGNARDTHGSGRLTPSGGVLHHVESARVRL